MQIQHLTDIKENKSKLITKLSKSSRKNPWRNTRNDFKMPWEKILGVVFLIFFPIAVIATAFNIVVRSNIFYTFYVSRSEVVGQLPYELEKENLSDAFRDFMIHKNSVFALTENSEYKPQQVFSDKDANMMADFRMVADILFIIGVLAIGVCVIIGIYFCREKLNKRLYSRYLKSWFFVVPIFAIFALLTLITPLRNAIITGLYGGNFEPNDSLLAIYNTQFWGYLTGFFGVVLLVLMLLVLYIMKKFIVVRKMFKL